MTTTAGEISDWSIKVTLYCASEPDAPEAPIALLAEQELVQISWDLPTINGGSSVLGFELEMRLSIDAEYTIIDDYNGYEDPTMMTY